MQFWPKSREIKMTAKLPCAKVSCNKVVNLQEEKKSKFREKVNNNFSWSEHSTELIGFIY